MSRLPRPQGSDLGSAADTETTEWELPSFTVSAAKSQELGRLRRQRQVERVCRIPRLVDELLSEIGRHHGIEDDVAARLDRYAAVDHDLLAALGADRFPASPMRVVGSRQ